RPVRQDDRAHDRHGDDHGGLFNGGSGSRDERSGSRGPSEDERTNDQQADHFATEPRQPYGRVILPRCVAERTQPQRAKRRRDYAGTENTDLQIGERITDSIELRPERVRAYEDDAGKRRCQRVAARNQRGRCRESRLEGDVQTEGSEKDTRYGRRAGENDRGERDGAWRPNQ